jgi:hypothetical protein
MIWLKSPHPKNQKTPQRRVRNNRKAFFNLLTILKTFIICLRFRESQTSTNSESNPWSF